MGSATLEAVIPATGVDIVGKAQDLCEVYPLMPECSPDTVGGGRIPFTR